MQKFNSKHEKKYILFIGSIFNDVEISKHNAISVAANNWQKKFIEENELNGLEFILMGHIPEPLWPRGQIIIKPSEIIKISESTKQYGVVGLQIPFLRNRLLTGSYKNKLLEIISKEGIPYLVITYNFFPFTYSICTYLKKKYNIPWVVLIADSPAKGVFSSRKKHDDLIAKADGRIFFSVYYFNKLRHLGPALHFEGGVDECKNSIKKVIEEKKRFIIMFTGSRGAHAGLNNLIKAMSLIINKNVVLWITGQGKSKLSEIDSIKNSNNNIKDYGFVDDERLYYLMTQADCFISPYEVKFEPNKYNFPSKILSYLSYGKPIISTASPGISQEYLNILSIAKSNHPNDLALKIDEVSNMTTNQLYLLHKEINNFIKNEKSWNRQCSKFNSWIKNEIL